MAHSDLPDVACTTHVAEGAPVPSILDFAERHGTDVIVMTTHGLTGLERLFLGTVAEKVIRRAPCPVLTLNTFGGTKR